MAPFSVVPNGNGCNTGADTRAFARPCSPRNPAEMVATLVWVWPCFCFGITDTAPFSAVPNRNDRNTGVDEAVHLIAQQQTTAQHSFGHWRSSRLQQRWCSSF